MPLIGRRRPLLRAAMVGGTAYYAGKQHERGAQHEDDQDAQIANAQQPAAPPPQQMAPAAPAPAVDPVTALTQAKALLDSGVLTQAEFDAQKRRILEGS